MIPVTRKHVETVANILDVQGEDQFDPFAIRDMLRFSTFCMGTKERLSLAASLRPAQEGGYCGFAALIISHHIYVPGQFIVTDLRSGPAFVDRFIQNERFWPIWLTHDILGSCGKDFAALNRSLLCELTDRFKVPYPGIVRFVTTVTQPFWIENNLEWRRL